MIGLNFTFAMYGFYASLCHNMVTLYRQRNITEINNKAYVIFPMIFGFTCSIFPTFFLLDVGVADFLVDGMTDGSLSELLHVLIVFIIIPYIIYSVLVLCAERKRIIGKGHKESLIDFGIISDKDLFKQHIQFVIVFLVGVVPSCLAEFIPMVRKTVVSTFGYILFSNLSIVCFSFSGLCISLIRINDPYLKDKLLQIAKRLSGEKETQRDVIVAEGTFLEEEKIERNSELFGSANYSLRLSSIDKSSVNIERTKSTYKQVEKYIICEVRIFIKELGYSRIISRCLFNDK